MAVHVGCGVSVVAGVGVSLGIVATGAGVSEGAGADVLVEVGTPDVLRGVEVAEGLAFFLTGAASFVGFGLAVASASARLAAGEDVACGVAVGTLSNDCVAVAVGVALAVSGASPTGTAPLKGVPVAVGVPVTAAARV